MAFIENGFDFYFAILANGSEVENCLDLLGTFVDFDSSYRSEAIRAMEGATTDHSSSEFGQARGAMATRPRPEMNNGMTQKG
jgi:hypothetical protein